MKNFKSILATLPSRTAVFVFGRMNPITIGHGLVIEKTKSIAATERADHFIYLSHSVDKTKNPLSEEKKLYWANRLYPNTTFVLDESRTFIDAAKALNKKYSRIIMVAGSDRVDEYHDKLNKYNGIEYQFESIKVISAGVRDTEDGISSMSATLLREHASEGKLAEFKKGIPAIRDSESRRYMNDVRVGLGLEPIKEELSFSTNPLREKYISGDLFEVGDIVESNGEHYEILSLGTNYVSVVKDGTISRKWLSEVHATDERKIFTNSIVTSTMIHFKGYFTKNFTKEITAAFYPLIESKKDAVAILTAIKSTDAYLDKNNNMITFKESYNKAKEYLTKLDVLDEHAYMLTYDFLEEALSDKTIKGADKLKVARIIGTFLSVDNAEAMSSPALIVNTGLRNMRKLPMTRDNKRIIDRVLSLAQTAGIDYDEKLIPAQLQEVSTLDAEVVPAIEKSKEEDDELESNDNKAIGHSLIDANHPMPDTLRRQKRKHHLGEADEFVPEPVDKTIKNVDFMQGIDDDNFDMSDEEIDAMLANIDDWDDIIDAYDDDEFSFVDPETGEEFEDEDDEEYTFSEATLLEVLSRQERIRGKLRMRKTKSKRMRSAKLALKRFSSSTVINRRARRLAVNTLKKKLIQGRDPKSLSVGEKERVERLLAKRKNVINRIALKMTAKVRKIEKHRMSAKNFTKN